MSRTSLPWLSRMAAPALLWPATCTPPDQPSPASTGSLLIPDPIPLGPSTYRHHGLWWTQAGQITNANNEGPAGSKVMAPTFQEAITQLEELGSNRAIENHDICLHSRWYPNSCPTSCSLPLGSGPSSQPCLHFSAAQFSSHSF